MSQTLDEMVDAMYAEQDAAVAELLAIHDALVAVDWDFADHREERAFDRQVARLEREMDRIADQVEKAWHKKMDAAGF